MKVIRDIKPEEDTYNASVNANPRVLEAIKYRDDGWDMYRSGDHQDGLSSIEWSVNLLTQYGDRVWPQMGQFARESYASVARYSQALCANGDFDLAYYWAEGARMLTPAGLVGSFSERGRGLPPAVEMLPDQYRITFGGRLAYVMAASTAPDALYSAVNLAIDARRLAGRAEDPRRVAFTDSEMSDERRREVRKIRRLEAWGAWATAVSPISLSQRQRIAQKVCAK